MLGIAITGLMAAFMAGVAANVTAFNTVVTYDLVQSYWKTDRDPKYYIRMGRLLTVAGILISIATAFIAKGRACAPPPVAHARPGAGRIRPALPVIEGSR